MASHCGIGHTRWATHGAPSDVNSHPHCAARVSLVHNGIIENYAQLKEHLMKRGYEFCSETDTEVLVKLLDHNYHGEPLDAILRTLEQVRGSYGLAILFKDFPGQIFSVRKESPLIVGYGARRKLSRQRHSRSAALYPRLCGAGRGRDRCAERG